MAAFTKLFSYTDKILAVFFLKVLPEILHLIILAICIVWKYYKLLCSNYKYTSTVNEKSSKFTYDKRAKRQLRLHECSICLLEFAEGDKVRQLVECKHTFHRDCLEKWLEGYTATCPLCRGLVVPEVIVAEYRRMRIERENNGIEKELALILLNAVTGDHYFGPRLVV